jgi:hypothetical protein
MAPLPNLDLNLALGGQTASTQAQLGARTGNLTFGNTQAGPSPGWSTWLPWLGLAGVGIVAAVLVWKMRRS